MRPRQTLFFLGGAPSPSSFNLLTSTTFQKYIYTYFKKVDRKMPTFLSLSVEDGRTLLSSLLSSVCPQYSMWS